MRFSLPCLMQTPTLSAALRMGGRAPGAFGIRANLKGSLGHLGHSLVFTARWSGGAVPSFHLTSGPLDREVQSFDLTSGWSGGEVKSFHLTSGPLDREVQSFYLTGGSLDREVQSFHLTDGASGRAILAQKWAWRPFWAYFHAVHNYETASLGGFKPALHTAGPALPMGRFKPFFRPGRTRVCP